MDPNKTPQKQVYKKKLLILTKGRGGVSRGAQLET
jgi:hypothetical protein